jgi:hypothetical protein
MNLLSMLHENTVKTTIVYFLAYSSHGYISIRNSLSRFSFITNFLNKRLNFIIYGISSQKYRKEFLHIFTSMCCFVCSIFLANAGNKSNVLSKSTHRDRNHHEHVNNHVERDMDKKQIFIRIEENSLYDLVVVLEEDKQRSSLNNCLYSEHEYSNEICFVRQKTAPPFFSSTKSIWLVIPLFSVSATVTSRPVVAGWKTGRKIKVILILK